MAGSDVAVESVTVGDKARVLNVQGEVTHAAEYVLFDAYTEAHGAGLHPIALNFSRVDFLNSSGASVLVKLHVLAKRRGERLRAYGLHGHYEEVFAVTGLDRAISVYHSAQEAVLEKGSASRGATAAGSDVHEEAGGDQPRDAACWASPVSRLAVPAMPAEARNLNVAGRGVVGPVEGFGQLWEKTYRVRLPGGKATPEQAIGILKSGFPRFQPPQNRFYPSPKGIAPGEIVLIDASTSGLPVSTGVVVLYADDVSFTFITPQGHPESGWVTFSAFAQDGSTVVQVQGLARANDPIYEAAFRLAGSGLQERIWRHVLSSLAAELGVQADVDVEKACLDTTLQWSGVKNVRYNAQIRTIVYVVLTWPLRAVRGRNRRREGSTRHA